MALQTYEDNADNQTMSPSIRPVLIVLLLLAACAAVYGPICRHPFVRWDDEINVYRNSYLNPVTVQSVKHFWISSEMGETCQVYRPVVYSVYALLAANAEVAPYLSDGEGAALNPHVFHEFSLLVHALNVLLVFALLRRLVRSDCVRRDWAAAFGALVFAVHPVQVEPVAWVTGLTDLLGAFFSLLALWEYSKFRENGSRRQYVLAVFCFVLALLSKPSCVVLPMLALALDAHRLGRSWPNAFRGDSLKWLVPWSLLSLGMVVLTHFAEPVMLASVVTPWWDRPLLAVDALFLSVRHLVWPVFLGVDYGRSPDVVLGETSMLWCEAIGLVVLAGLLWLSRRRLPWLLAPAAFFVLALLPVLGLVPFRFQTFSTVADRYLYLAMLGPALLLAEAVSRAPSQRLAGAAACGVVLLLAMLTVKQTAVWRSTDALWAQTLAVNPESWLARYNRGVLSIAQGKPEQAHSEFQELVRLKPEYKTMGLP